MEYGIQRRSIYLLPPSDTDLDWMFEQYDHEDVWSMFGFSGPSRDAMRERHAVGNVVAGVIHRLEDDARIGFVNVFPPKPPLEGWELGFAISDPADRDGWSALSAADAMAHYLFDHLGLETVVFRVRQDNRASQAVVRRLGYTRFGAWDEGEHRFDFFNVTRAKWDKRVAKLERGEAAHPSPAGQVFLALDGPPFDPKRGE